MRKGGGNACLLHWVSYRVTGKHLGEVGAETGLRAAAVKLIQSTTKIL